MEVHLSDGAKLSGDATNGAKVDVTRIAAGETHVGQSTWPMVIVPVTAVLDTSVYANADVLTDTMTLAGALRAAGKGARLRSIVVLDEDDQTPYTFAVYFFQATQSLGTKNGAITLTDAGMRDCLGVVTFATADAQDAINSRIYTKSNIDLPLVAAAGVDVFASAAIITGTPTHTASGLKFKFGIEQH